MGLSRPTIRLLARTLATKRSSGAVVTLGSSLHQDASFRMLGFSVVDRLDSFEDERPTFRVDLNQPIPHSLRGRYDLLVDEGTTEHCFDVRQVLANAVAVLKPGG